MPDYEFEVQSLIKIRIRCDNKDDARMHLIDTIEDYAYEMMSDCYISDGEDVKE